MHNSGYTTSMICSINKVLYKTFNFIDELKYGMSERKIVVYLFHVHITFSRKTI